MTNRPSYRFENTYHDLRECFHHLEMDYGLSGEEQRYRRKLLALAWRIVQKHGEEAEYYAEYCQEE
jgi:hypothetical protein